MYNFLTKHASKLLIIFLITIFTLTLRGLPGNLHPKGVGKEKIIMNTPPFETSMERGRYAQIIALAENRTFSVDKFSDFLKPDLAWYNGHYYPAFPPGVSILALPAFFIGQYFSISQITTYATSALFTILTAFLMLKIAPKMNLSKRAAIFASLIFAVTSCTFAYSVTLSAHPVSAFFIALCFLAGISIIQGQKTFLNFALLWFAYAINIFIDYPNLFILLPLLALTFFKSIDIKKKSRTLRIKIPLTILYSAIVLLPILYFFIDYSLYHYQQPIAFTNRYNLKVLDIQGIKFDQLSNDLFSQKPYANRFDISKFPRGIYALLISHDRGLFFYSPIYLLAIAGLIYSIVKKQIAWEIILLTFLANILIYGIFDDPWGGWGFGPRYLIPTLPLIALLAARAFDYLREFNFAKQVLTFLILYSLATSLLGALGSNAIPPAVEAPYAKMHDNFLASWDYLSSGKSSSFIYNAQLKNSITPLHYFYILFAFSAIIKLLIIWTPITYNNPEILNLKS